MHYTSIIILTAIAGLSFASPTPIQPRETLATNVVLFTSPTDANWTAPGVLYARSLQLANGDLLATWENYSPEPPLVHFPIYKSSDNGSTWAEISQVNDTVNGWGLRYQPDLFQLPEAVGDFPKGTILCTGNSIPTDLSETKLDVYASTDNGLTWSFVSSLGTGGEARPNNGLTPIWEPHLVYINGTVAAFYSDQRDPSFGQKLVHTTSTNLLNWTTLVDDIHDTTDYDARPGMPAVAQLPTGNWIFAYEICGSVGGCKVSYRLGSSPLTMVDQPAHLLTTTTGGTLTSSPTITWSPVGGVNGTLILSSGSQQQVFTNQALGDPSAWVARNVPNPASYSRWVDVFANDPSKLMIISGGPMSSVSGNKITFSAVDVASLISS